MKRIREVNTQRYKDPEIRKQHRQLIKLAMNRPEVRKKLLELRELYDIKSIGFDPYNAYQEISRWQDEDGFNVVEYRQGVQTMGGPTKEFERLALDGKIIHGGNPVLRWMMDNVGLRIDVNDNYMVGKGKISTGKVDGVVASIIGIGEAMEYKEKEPDIYIGVW